MPRILRHSIYTPLFFLLALPFVWNHVTTGLAAGCAIVQLGGDVMSFNVGNGPRSMVAADFNHDGKNDLAVANYGSGLGAANGGISILLNNGLGAFSSGASLPAGVNPRYIVSADFDKDGDPDLAVINYVSANCCIASVVTIYLGDGAGNFAAFGSPVAVGNDASALVAGDFNKDGKADLAATRNSNVTILLGDGSGGFGSATSFPAGGAATSIATGDLNNDTKPDLVTSHLNSFGFSVLLGDGFGAFAAPVNYSLTPANPRFISVGDFNQDSKLDVVTSNTSQTLAVLLGNGDGTFGTPTLFNVDASPESVLVQDVNADGKPDLVTASALTGTVSILIGNGLGSFGSLRSYFSGSGAYFPVSGDFNNDGKIDLAIANATANQVTLLPGTGNGAFAGARTFNVGLAPLSVAGGDLNGDGKIDLVLANAAQDSISVLLGDGAGAFGPDVKFPAGFSPKDVVLQDFNNDGKLDAAVANGTCCQNTQSVSLLLGDGNGGFGAKTSFTAGTNATGIVSADFNKDGNLDLAVINNADKNFSILIGNGNGSFSSPTNVSLGTIPVDLATADFNRDGNTDLVIAASPVSVFLGNGAGDFSPGTSISLSGNSIAVGDVNGDGFADLAISNMTGINTGNLRVVLGDGAGQFGAASTYSIGLASSVALADLNGDGKTDLAASVEPSSVFVLPGDGAGGFGSASSFLAGSGPRGMLATDLNGDGRTDLAMANAGHFLSVLLNTCLTVDLPATFAFSAGTYSVSEGGGSVSLTVVRSVPLNGASTVNYISRDMSGANGCNVTNGSASQRCDYLPTLGRLHFAAGETSKTITVPIVDDSYAEGSENFTISLSNPTGAVLAAPATALVTINDNETVNGPNPIDQANFFVRQHYLDFLNREPDAAGLAFWSNQITECLQPGATCNADERRINVSAAFFLSIEFQETGYLVERLYKSAYGDATGTSNFGPTHQLPVPVVRFHEFLPDSQQISQGVVVGVGNWEALLEANKVAFTQDFVARSRFTTEFPTTLTPAQFVDALFTNAGVTPSTADRDAAITEFSGAGNTAETAARARALRRVAENATLTDQEKNKAFVLMQYYGYLRRDPNQSPDIDYSGYDFWLTKLNQFNGNFVTAEMVKAFITSGEYRQRFGQ